MPEVLKNQPEAVKATEKVQEVAVETVDASKNVEATDATYRAEAKREVTRADAQILAMKDKIGTTKKQEGAAVS